MTCPLGRASEQPFLQREAASAVLPHGGSGQALMSMPFDALRRHYANAVMAGLVPRSLLASARSERAIDTLEKFVLGPIARQR